jgi:hypothetical protein
MVAMLGLALAVLDPLAVQIVMVVELVLMLSVVPPVAQLAAALQKVVLVQFKLQPKAEILLERPVPYENPTSPIAPLFGW